MKWQGLVMDFDGTLGEDGKVEPVSLEAIRALRKARIYVILATGRTMQELKTMSLDLTLFSLIVAEDGGILYDPEAEREVILAPLLDPGLVKQLQAAGVAPLKTGQCIVSTQRDNEDKVVGVCKLRAGTCHVLRDKGSLSILPAGTDKASGVRAAQACLGILPAWCIGMGDAENDIDLLKACGLPVAVSTALPEVKASAKVVLASDSSGAVEEVARKLLSNEFAPFEP